MYVNIGPRALFVPLSMEKFLSGKTGWKLTRTLAIMNVLQTKSLRENYIDNPDTSTKRVIRREEKLEYEDEDVEVLSPIPRK